MGVVYDLGRMDLERKHAVTGEGIYDHPKVKLIKP